MIDEGGNVVCATGGLECLTLHVEELKVTYSSTRVVYTINGVEITFLITHDGQVTNENTGEVICETGGEDCLIAYVESKSF